MNLAREALIQDRAQIHAAHWPSLSTLAGWDSAGVQIQAMMQNHAITGQCFVICASSPVPKEALQIFEEKLGPQKMLSAGGGWSAIIHPFASVMAGPACTDEETLVTADINLDDLKDVKMWVDPTGHYARPDVLQLLINRQARKPLVEVL
jgi:predicted amidohydrolase